MVNDTLTDYSLPVYEVRRAIKCLVLTDTLLLLKTCHLEWHVALA